MAFFFLARSWALRSCAHLLCRWWDPPGNARDFWKFWDASALKRCRFHGVDRFLASNRVHTSGVPRTCEGYRSRSKKLMASPTLDPHAKLLQALCRKAGLTHTNTHDHSTIQDGPISTRLHLPSPLTRPLLPYAAVWAPRAPLPEILVSLAAAPWMAKGRWMEDERKFQWALVEWVMPNMFEKSVGIFIHFSWNLEWQKRYDMSRNCQESNGDYFQRIQLFMLFLIG